MATVFVEKPTLAFSFGRLTFIVSRQCSSYQIQ
jgi:hypothetical protein